jgi:DNA modification methylase
MRKRPLPQRRRRKRVTTKIIRGDCLEVLAGLKANSIDACVTDPPYGLVFMGRDWDRAVPGPAYWRAVFRVLKPGAHLLAFAGTRTYHRMACAIEDAGFEIRDTIMWVYGSGFPKSLDVSKAIDKARDDHAALCAVTSFVANALRKTGKSNADVDALFGFNGMAGHWTTKASQPAVPTWDQWIRLKKFLGFTREMDAEVWRLNGRKGKPGENWNVVAERKAGCATGSVYGDFAQRVEINDPTAAARQWSGFGTALKPACEPIVIARKPLSESTVAANVLKWGTGALNIDACRVTAAEGDEPLKWETPRGGIWKTDAQAQAQALGRWPANLIHDGSDEVVGAFPDGVSFSGARNIKRSSGKELNGNSGPTYGKESRPAGTPMIVYGDSGSAARFFYCAKASRNERAGSKHPTVKPLKLMRYLVRLVTPPGGTVLDHFAGTGTTGQAARAEGFSSILVERERGYVRDIKRRLGTVANFTAVAA